MHMSIGLHFMKQNNDIDSIDGFRKTQTHWGTNNRCRIGNNDLKWNVSSAYEFAVYIVF